MNVDPCLGAQIYQDVDLRGQHIEDRERRKSNYDAAAEEAWWQRDRRGTFWRATINSVDWKWNWTTVYPTSKSLELTNGAVTNTLRVWLNVGQETATCVMPAKTNTPHTTKSIDHELVCHRCAGPYWKHRHNIGLAAMFRVAEKFNVAMQADVHALLGDVQETVDRDDDDLSSGEDDGDRVRRTKKRPDGYVTLPNKGAPGIGGVISMFDFTVVHVIAAEKYEGTHPITRARYLKVKKYERLLKAANLHAEPEQDAAAAGSAGGAGGAGEGADMAGVVPVNLALGSTVTPIVITAIGFFDEASAFFFKRVAALTTKPGFVHAVTAAISISVLNAQSYGISTARMRKIAKQRAGASVEFAPSAISALTNSAA